MPRLFFGISAVTLATWWGLAGCGESSSSNDGGAGGATGQAAGTDAGSASGAGKPIGGSGSAAGNISSGAASGDAAGAGNGSAGGSDSGVAGAPEADGKAGSGPSDGLVACDPKRAACKVPPGQCPVMQVREVLDGCWGDCVEIAQCACSSAAECPDANQYTCWMGRHCGPYVN